VPKRIAAPDDTPNNKSFLYVRLATRLQEEALDGGLDIDIVGASRQRFFPAQRSSIVCKCSS
jgi:hypothetical protein